MTKLHKGQRVYWNDPDNGASSGMYKILQTIDADEDSIILIGDKHSEAEVLLSELDVEIKVVFRKFKQGGDIIALFPEQTNNLMVASYQHVGQHSDADYNGVISTTTPATETEWAPLLTELKNIGYENIKVMKKCKPKYN